MKQCLFMLLIGLLSGCVANRGAAPEKNIGVYDLGPVNAPLSSPIKAPLALEVRLPSWLDTTSVFYRLQYQDANRVHEYALARWVAPPASLLQQRLRQQLRLAATEGCSLSVDVQDFGQSFSSATVSTVRISAEVRVLNRTRQVLASRSIHIEQPASSPDAAGGVRALANASDTLAQQLQEWLPTLTEQLAGCRAVR